MKRIILSALMLASCLVAAAQTQTQAQASTDIKIGVYDPNRVSTSDEIRQLAQKLELNEGQYVRLRDLMRARQDQVAQINNMYANDATMRQSKLGEVQKDFETNLAQSISPKQFNAYLALTGRTPGTTPGSGFQAGGYGGSALEMGAVNRAGGATADSANTTTGAPTNTNTNTPGSTNMSGGTSTGANTNGGVKVEADKVKMESGSNELKVKSNKEKVETGTAEYKADGDEAKFKTKDGAYKAKTEKDKSKLETPNAKVKVKK